MTKTRSALAVCAAVALAALTSTAHVAQLRAVTRGRGGVAKSADLPGAAGISARRGKQPRTREALIW